MPDDVQKDVTEVAEQNASVQELTSPETTAQAATQSDADEVVPKKAFLARVGEESEKRRRAEDEARIEREARIRAEAERDAARQAPVQAQARKTRYSLVDLQNAVDAGQIDQRKMWEIWEQQNDERITEAATAKAREVFSESTVVNRIQSKRHAYSRLVPGWNTPGTDANRRAEVAFLDLLADGLPRTAATEVLALERAFGALDALERTNRSNDLTQQERTTSVEVGNTGVEKLNGNKKVNFRKLLTPGEMADYTRQVEAGDTTWEEVENDVLWSLSQNTNGILRDKMQARLAGLR